MKRIFLSALLLFIPLSVLADAFVPEFNKMRTLRCDFTETVYNQDGSVASKSNLFRVFKLDDENSKIYLQKEPIDRILYYGSNRIEFVLQSMTDDVIISTHTNLNRQTNEYQSNSEITYDNLMFGTKTAKSVGSCRFVD